MFSYLCFISFSKKKILERKLGKTNVNELTLYHEADPSLVDGICAHNFDWRSIETNQKNDFGCGNYFYKDLDQCFRNNNCYGPHNIQYVFLAKVLAGKYITVSR